MGSISRFRDLRSACAAKLLILRSNAIWIRPSYDGARMIARLMARVGLVTPEQRAWAWYDWANSVYFTTVITAVFPSFFATYAAKGLEPAQATARFGADHDDFGAGRSRSISPILGALADYSGIKKRLLAIFMSDRRHRVRGDGPDRRGRHHAGVGAVLHRQHRRVGIAGLLRLAAAARRQGRAKPIGCRPPATRWATSAAA